MSEIEMLEKIRDYHFKTIDQCINEIGNISREIEVLKSIELEEDLIRSEWIARGEWAPNG
jgi:hypothetical protein